LLACYAQLVGETTLAPVETPKAVEIDPGPAVEIETPIAEAVQEPVAEPPPGMPAKVQLDVVQVTARPVEPNMMDAETVDENAADHLTPIAERRNVTPPPGAAASLFGEAANG
jgi:hypothetical protein